MEEDLRALLLSDAGVTALAGTSIAWGGQTQGVPGPYVVLWSIGGVRERMLGGQTGLMTGRVQADCYAPDYGTAKRLSRAVIAVLAGYSGGIFQGIFHDATRDGNEGGAALTTSEATRPYNVSLDFTYTCN